MVIGYINKQKPKLVCQPVNGCEKKIETKMYNLQKHIGFLSGWAEADFDWKITCVGKALNNKKKVTISIFGEKTCSRIN